MKGNGRISGSVHITGIINAHEFSAHGTASGDPATGDYRLSLEYDEIPPGWHPFAYVDPKVGLLFHREEDGGRNLLSLADGTYRSAGTLDLGEGNFLHNNAHIRMTGATTFEASYMMFGTAHLHELAAVDYFEETMLPMGPGRLGGLALTRWSGRNKEVIDGFLATRYQMASKRGLDRPQLRRFEAKPSLKGNVFTCEFNGYVRALPRMVEAGGPYIGNLIA